MPAPPPAVGVDDVRREVTRLVPSASIGVAPQGWTLVNIETVIWLNAPRHRALAPVTILGHQVSIELAFDHARLDFGDGTSATWPAPGRAYDNAGDPCSTTMCPDYSGHVYRDTGDMTVRATVAWHATFTVDGGNRVAIPGTVSGPSATTDIPVKQARGELVHDPGN